MLRYDEIPAERLPILDYTSRLGDDGHIGDLAVALAMWAARDDTRADPDARRAANTAMTALDAALRELHELRARLVSEIRASDEASAARVDELLAGSLRRGGYGEGMREIPADGAKSLDGHTVGGRGGARCKPIPPSRDDRGGGLRRYRVRRRDDGWGQR